MKTNKTGRNGVNENKVQTEMSCDTSEIYEMYEIVRFIGTVFFFLNVEIVFTYVFNVRFSKRFETRAQRSNTVSSSTLKKAAQWNTKTFCVNSPLLTQLQCSLPSHLEIMQRSENLKVPLIASVNHLE